MKKKILIISLSVLTLVLSIVGILTINHFSNLADKSDELVVNLQDNDGIRLNKLSTSTGVTVTATVNPDYVVDNTLNWSLAWATSNSATISDYVSMEVSSDTHSVTLNYVKQFSTQIILTATSNQTTSVKATCTIDCYQRTMSIDTLEFNVKLGEEKFAMADYYNAQTKAFDFSQFSFDELFNKGDSSLLFNLFEVVSFTKVGTISTVQSFSYELNYSDELINAFKSAAVEYGEKLPDTSIEWLLSDLFEETDKELLYETLSKVDHWFDITVTIQDKNGSNVVNTITETYSLLGFNIQDAFEVLSLTLNKTNVVF